MSTRLEKKLENLTQTLDHLVQESARGTAIVVEGKKDLEALRELGVQGKILSAKTGGRSFLDLLSEIEEAEPREVILLFDFDRRGREWTKRLKMHLEKARIKANVTFWCELYKLLGKDVKDIESITTYMETLKSKTKNS
ncbi:toprim domain-containing protein [Candidatus Bathyarchaeota archaeon]|nr:toprim domain-containing protein [Candidatus Bathyarchaeota archaeon]